MLDTNMDPPQVSQYHIDLIIYPAILFAGGGAMSNSLYLAFWNLENLFDVETAGSPGPTGIRGSSTGRSWATSTTSPSTAP